MTIILHLLFLYGFFKQCFFFHFPRIPFFLLSFYFCYFLFYKGMHHSQYDSLQRMEKYFHNLQLKNEEYRDAHSHHENYGTICFMPQSSVETPSFNIIIAARGTMEKNLLMQEQESNQMKVASLQHISSPTSHNVRFPQVMVIPPTLPDA